MPRNDPPLSLDIDAATIAPVTKSGSHAAALGKPAAVRKCILTGSHGERGALIRLALSPEGQVAVDLGARAPGRGAWLSPDRRLVETAAAKGKLRGALMRAFKTNAVTLPENLAEAIATGLERRALDRLGLENRAGHLIWGSDRIGDALAAGRVRLLLHAADAAPDGIGKLEAKRRGSPRDNVASAVLPVGRLELSLALGRENVVHAAICDAGAAARVAAAVARWRAFAGTDDDVTVADNPAAEV